MNKKTKSLVCLILTIFFVTLSFNFPNTNALSDEDWYGSVSVEGSKNSSGGEYNVVAKPAVPSLSFGSSGIGLSLPIPITTVESVTTTVTGSNISPQITTDTNPTSIINTRQTVTIPRGVKDGVITTTVTYTPNYRLAIASPIAGIISSIAQRFGLIHHNRHRYTNVVITYLP